MPHVASIFGLLEKLESSFIAVHQNRCAVVRNRNATCQKCADACTSGCISIAENELTIEPEKCIGCGTCATVCPTCALEAQHPNDAELLLRSVAALQAAEGEAVIACEHLLKTAEGLYDPDKVVGVACLGRIEESLLISLVNEGAVHISLVKAQCATCPQAVGLDTVEKVSATTRALLAAWNKKVAIDVVEKLPSCVRLKQEKEYDHGRREFFSSMRGEARSFAVKASDHVVNEALGVEHATESRYLKVMDDGTLPHFIPDRRERLLDGLAALGEPQDVMIATRLWGHVVIDLDLCSSCQMCATFCPTGALVKFTEEDGTFGIDHVPSDCVKCGCCTDICKEGALHISDEVFAVDLLSGASERYEMKPLVNPPGKPDSILHAVKDLIGIDQVYER